MGIDTGFSIYDQADRLRVVKSVMDVIGLGRGRLDARAGRVGDQPRQERTGQPGGHEAPRR